MKLCVLIGCFLIAQVLAEEYNPEEKVGDYYQPSEGDYYQPEAGDYYQDKSKQPVDDSNTDHYPLPLEEEPKEEFPPQEEYNEPAEEQEQYSPPEEQEEEEQQEYKIQDLSKQFNEENEVDRAYNRDEDPCADKECGPGHECDIDENDRPICVCISRCPVETDPRAKVCSSLNITFEGECELHRQRCLCHKNHQDCNNFRFANVEMDYYGPCKEFKPCTEGELKEYPLRMREWLFVVMEELARRQDLNKQEERMAQEAATSAKKWVVPVIWKFCDLDSTHDRLISTKELLPIAAPLKPLEHCTEPFLKHCDDDYNGFISLEEWGNCLGLDKDDISDLCDNMKP